jgi:hypothetical protein
LFSDRRPARSVSFQSARGYHVHPVGTRITAPRSHASPGGRPRLGGIEFYGLVFEFDSFFDEFERQFCIVDNTGMELGDLKIKQDVTRPPS